MKPAPALGSFLKKIFLHNLKVVKNSKITLSTVAFNQKEDSSISDIFDSWCKEHGKAYNSQKEREYRMRVFEEKYKRIKEINEKGGSSFPLGTISFSLIEERNEKGDISYKHGLNNFSDLTDYEFKAMYCRGYRSLTPREWNRIRSEHSELNVMMRSKIRSDGDDDVGKSFEDPASMDGLEEEQGSS